MTNTKPVTYYVNPECATELSRISTIQKQVVEMLKHVTETVYGNGKTGLQDLTAENSRAIVALQLALNKMVESNTKTDEMKETEAKEKRGDMRKFWLQAALTILVSGVGAAQIVVIFLLTGK